MGFSGDSSPQWEDDVAAIKPLHLQGILSIRNGLIADILALSARFFGDAQDRNRPRTEPISQILQYSSPPIMHVSS